ncbi:MAG TPA: hypothetical protein H9677_06595 [Firmicutes bacterium]|nr:hypothetical protein [Bacillota bacterium]
MSKLTQLLASKIVLQRDLAPKSESAHGARAARMREVLGGNTAKMFTLNIFTVLFALPMICVLIIWLPIEESNAVANLNFSANLGIGYGAVDQTLEGIAAIYNLRQLFILCTLTPGFMIMSIGISGAMHVLRNYMWGVDVKLLRHFGRGIAKHWYKFLPVFTVGGLLATSAGYSLIEVLKQNALYGAAGAGYYVWTVFSFIFCFFFAMFLFMYMPMCVAYRFKAKDLLKNCFTMGLIVFVTTLLLVILLGGIPLIAIANDIVMYLIYGFFLLFGFSLYLLIITAYGQYACENLIEAQLDVKEEMEAKKAEQERKAAVRQQAKQPKSQKGSAVASYKKSRKAKNAAVKEVRDYSEPSTPSFVTEEEAERIKAAKREENKPVYKGGPYNKGKKKR